MSEQTETDTAELVELGDLHQRAGNLQQADEHYRAALAQDPENADAYNGLGLLALRIGEYPVAEQLLRMAVELAPTDTTFLCNLGTALYGQEQLDEAAAVFQQAIDSDDQCAKALLNLGLIYKARQDYERATQILDRAVVADPRQAEAFAHMADALMQLDRYESAENIARAAVNLDNRHVLAQHALTGALLHLARPQEALSWARRLLRLAPGEADHYRLLAEALSHSGLPDEAHRHARSAIALNPNDTDALGLLAQTYGARGEYQAAKDTIEQALAIDPDNGDLIAAKARILERMGHKAEGFALVKPLIKGRNTVSAGTLNSYIILARRVGEQREAARIVSHVLSGDLASRSHFGLYFAAGQLYDDLGEYDRAFDYYRHGNKLKPRSYDRDQAVQLFDHLKRQYTPELFRELTGLGSTSRRPIFIVGMPRSGTSLTEQIMASHGEVFAGGELTEMERTAQKLPELLGTTTPYPDCVSELTESSAQKAAQRYLDFIGEIAPETYPRVTDKMPQNFAQLGLIALLFPNAKVIHCQRDPLDTCLSCYFQNFGAAGLQFAYDLENLGHYYRLYHDLMSHWRETLPMPMYELSYEQLVTDRETEIRRMLEFCELEWDDACLDHTQSGVQTITASYDQVRQPIYTRSISRWRKYEKHLQPLIDALGEDIVGPWL